MKVLVIGLGSMGKRRVRNLTAVGGVSIAGLDVRADRRAEASAKYGITAYGRYDEALAHFAPDALVISTGPAHHMDYAHGAADAGLPCFIEASVVDADRIAALHERTKLAGPVMAPSCTMRHFPGPRIVKRLMTEGVIGRPLSGTYHVGQYLPDWHPWERIEDFYVSHRATGGAREIVPFELTWLNDVFGTPEPLACAKAKLTDLPADIDDTYMAVLRYDGHFLLNLTIDVVARPHATRIMRLLGSEGELVFDGDANEVRYATVRAPEWVRLDLGGGTVEAGYIYPEEPYVAEMRDFIAAVRQRDARAFPNSLMDDFHVLQTLYRLEALSEGAR